MASTPARTDLCPVKWAPAMRRSIDPSGRSTGDIPVPRTGLSSSVDILPLLVSLGYNGSPSWMTGDLAAIYGKRLNLLRMLKSASAPARPYVVFADDDPGAQLYNFNNSP